ncbi:hypothetical protein Q8F55_006625 [Vanrija albida]|uniref:Glutaredoxin domain-containing protein n=1 Tax=Vanrija albida TaxID=181172 RepID=A0ABR3PXN1_9TREE
MTSPLHKFLFSPPPSPPLATDAQADPNSPFTPLASLLPGAAPLDPKVSPRVAQRGRLDAAASLPSRFLSPNSPTNSMSLIDVEAANAGFDSEEKKSPSILSPLLSPRLAHYRATIPRPILRLLFFAVVLFTCVAVLVITDKRAPATSGPHAYAPPQATQARKLRKQLSFEKGKQAPLVAPNPRTFRPNPHPLPASHELLALTWFVQESAYNKLPSNLDASFPLDAATIIGPVGAGKLGDSDSEGERNWLRDLKEEFESNVIVWFSGSAPPFYALEGIQNRHGHGKRVSMVSTSNRPDAHVVRGILQRLGYDLDRAPVLIIGGEAIEATAERMAELRESGELGEKLSEIGWVGAGVPSKR